MKIANKPIQVLQELAHRRFRLVSLRRVLLRNGGRAWRNCSDSHASPRTRSSRDAHLSRPLLPGASSKTSSVRAQLRTRCGQSRIC